MSTDLARMIPDFDSLVLCEVPLPGCASLMLLREPTKCKGCNRMVQLMINRGSTLCRHCDEERQ